MNSIQFRFRWQNLVHQFNFEKRKNLAIQYLSEVERNSYSMHVDIQYIYRRPDLLQLLILLPVLLLIKSQRDPYIRALKREREKKCVFMQDWPYLEVYLDVLNFYMCATK